MGGKHYNWTEEIDQFLIENYKKLGCKKCCEILNLPRTAVQCRANKYLNIKMYSHIRWTDELLEELIENYAEKGVDYFVEKYKLPKTALSKKCSQMGLKRKWKNISYNKSLGYLIYRKGKTYVIALHRKIMQDYLGRLLTPEEIVHHIDGDKLNNNIENLQLMTRAKHCVHHLEDRKKINIAK